MKRREEGAGEEGVFGQSFGWGLVGGAEEGGRVTRRPTARGHVTLLKVIGCDIVSGLVVLLRHGK